jgi:LysM repeat protein
MWPGNYRTRLRLLVFCLCAYGFLLVAFPTQKVQAQSAERIHIVQPGETLGAIAAKYGITYQQLAHHNGISNPNLVRVGQRLRIPSSSSASPPVYVAPTPAPSSAQATTAPTWPTATPAPPPSTQICRGELSYSVRSGDSLYRIAASYGVTMKALVARNNLPSTLIVVGQRLIIPANC